MEQVRKKTAKHEGPFHPAISQFLRWFLLRETLVKDKGVAELLQKMDQGQVKDEGGWAESIRRALLPHILGVLTGILERPMKPEELRFVFEKVEDFIGHYALERAQPPDDFRMN